MASKSIAYPLIQVQNFAYSILGSIALLLWELHLVLFALLIVTSLRRWNYGHVLLTGSVKLLGFILMLRMLHLLMACVINGLVLRTIPRVSELLKPLEEVITLKFIPALVGRAVSVEERALLALPIRLGGLGIVDPQTVSRSEFAASEKVTYPLVARILQHELSFDGGILDAQRLAKSEVVLSKCQAQEEKAESVCGGLPTELK